MKIGIDIRTLETAHRFRGIGVYARELISQISQIDAKNKYVFFSQKDNEKLDFIKNKNFHYQNLQIRKNADFSKYNWPLDQIYFPCALKKSHVDLVHILDQLSCPIAKPAKTIVTVHDLIQVTGYHKTNIKNKIKLWPVKHADKIIAISQAVKKDLEEVLKINPARIKVIYNGYNQKLFVPVDDKKNKLFRKKLVGNGKYLLYIGSFGQYEPRKNLDFLIKMFQKLSERGNSSNILLVMVGVLGPESERLKKIIKDRNIDDKVKFVGHVKHQDLPKYFQAAEIFLFPSLCEGFGLPPLEAMASGTPVISSNKTSLPEVIGNGGILLDPDDLNQWVLQIENLLDDYTLRKELIGKGLLQAKKFSWKKCAQETINTYKEVYDAKN